jgi:hypothetical protein
LGFTRWLLLRAAMQRDPSTLLTALTLGMLLAGCTPQKPQPEKWDQANALPPLAREVCVEPTQRELAVYDLAAAAIEHGDVGEPNSLSIGAKRLLAHGLFRADAERGAHRVCIPRAALERASLTFKARGGLGRGRLTEDELTLAARLPNADAAVVDQVGKSAFSELVQPSSTFARQDIRPLARTVLAGLGPAASKYADKAFGEIAIDTALGTGAAQVAVAGGHPGALSKVAELMEGAIARVPYPKAIPYAQKNRLYELSWAVVYAGASGRQYTRMIHTLMRREVESHAPPFGMIELAPKQLCTVLERIEGPSALTAYSYCNDPKVPYDK